MGLVVTAGVVDLGVGRRRDARPKKRAPTVLVIGDSNLELATPEVEQVLSDGPPRFSPVVHSAIGKGLKDNDDYWLPLLPGLLAESKPRCVVVALGANDDPVASDTESFPERLDAFVRALGRRVVLWVTHADFRDDPAPANARVINDDIVAAATNHARLRVVDYAAAVDRHPQWIGDDRLHLSSPGRLGFAKVVLAALRSEVSCRGRRAPRPGGTSPR